MAPSTEQLEGLLFLINALITVVLYFASRHIEMLMHKFGFGEIDLRNNLQPKLLITTTSEK